MFPLWWVCAFSGNLSCKFVTSDIISGDNDTAKQRNSNKKNELDSHILHIHTEASIAMEIRIHGYAIWSYIYYTQMHAFWPDKKGTSTTKNFSQKI